MKQKGGKLKAKEVKDFLNASYDKKPPNDLDGYILDKSLSSATAKVYYNPQTNHAVVAHRGTKGAADWSNNLAYAFGAYTYTNRYKKGKKTQEQAEAKYGKENISTLGHSQGAILARKLGTDTKEVININPAYTFEKPAKNEYNIRSSTDVISSLYAPVAKTKERELNDITIPSESTTDVLGEHSYEILDRLGDKEIGVGAGIKFSSNNIMKAGKRYSRLGYTGEDIDWIGGGTTPSRTTNTRSREENLARAQEAMRTIDAIQARQAREARQLNILENTSKEGKPLPQPKPKRGAGAGASIMIDKMNPQNRGIVFFNEGQLVPAPEYYSDSDVSEETLPETFDLSESDEEQTGRGRGGRRIFPTNNNNGAVGTPYVNRGTNPYGVRGGAVETPYKTAERPSSPTVVVSQANPDDFEEEEEGVLTEEYITDFLQYASNYPPTDPTRLVEFNYLMGRLQEERQDVGASEENDENIEDLMSQIDNLILEDLNGSGRKGGSKIRKSLTKGITKGFTKAQRGFQKGMDKINLYDAMDKVNPITQASKNKDVMKASQSLNPIDYALSNPATRNLGIQLGQITNDYLLPATVSAGKPIYDATAMSASTLLTGNPLLGKKAADTMWNEMVAKKGIDPRDRQKSKELGILSGVAGEALAKPYSAALGGGFHDGHSSTDKYFKPPKGLRRGNGRENRFRLKAEGTGGKRDLRYDIEDEERRVEKAEDKARYLARPPSPPPPPPRTPLTQEEIGDIFQGYGRRKMKAGSRLTIWEKLYDIVNPPDSFETWKERNQNRRITKAMKEEIEAQHEAMLMRQKADALERKAKETKEQKIKSAKEYGEFENVSPQEVERIRMTIEDKGSRDLRTEGKIASEDPEYAMDGKGRRKSKMKGGSNDALMKVALLVGVPMAALVGCVSVGQIYDLIEQYGRRNQVAPQQEEFKDAMPDIEEGGRRMKMKGGKKGKGKK